MQWTSDSEYIHFSQAVKSYVLCFGKKFIKKYHDLRCNYKVGFRSSISRCSEPLLSVYTHPAHCQYFFNYFLKSPFCHHFEKKPAFLPFFALASERAGALNLRFTYWSFFTKFFAFYPPFFLQNHSPRISVNKNVNAWPVVFLPPIPFFPEKALGGKQEKTVGKAAVFFARPPFIRQNSFNMVRWTAGS